MADLENTTVACPACGLPHGPPYRKRKEAVDCPLCGGALSGSRWCSDCRLAYARGHRRRHADLSQEERFKANARTYLNVYVKRGIVRRLPCEVCGDPRSQGHHANGYDRPLDVVWLCDKHHRALHLEIKAARSATTLPA
jgi:hypothetical protein